MSKSQYWASLVLVVLGCSSSWLPPASNPQRAREALEIGLDAWKGGQTAESLQSRTPKIIFNDDVWTPNTRLIGYAIRSEGVNGQGWRCDVQLTLRGQDGSSWERISSYQIDTDPTIVIVQQP